MVHHELEDTVLVALWLELRLCAQLGASSFTAAQDALLEGLPPELDER